jgi:hypothetical protein
MWSLHRHYFAVLFVSSCGSWGPLVPSSASEKRRSNPVQGKKTSKNQRVHEQAYLIWLEEGRPEGRDKEHWERAEQVVDRMDEISKDDESG